MKNIILVLIFIIFLSCKNDKNINKLKISEYEQIVFYEIFPDILDSIYLDNRIPRFRPPPPDYFNQKKYKNNMDKAITDWKNTEQFQKEKYYRDKVIDSLNKDTNPIYIIVPDSIHFANSDNINELKKHFGKENIEADLIMENFSNSFKLDQSKLISHNEKIKFKYKSDFDKNRKIWRTKHPFHIGGVIGISTVTLNKNKTHGVLECGLSTARLNGFGYRIFIRKDKNNKWTIDKIIVNGIV